MQKWGGNVKKCFLIARSNLRRTKGQTVAIVALIFIASMMLNLWLMLSTDYKSNFDRYHDKMNAEHVTLAISGNDSKMREFVSQTLEKDERTTGYCMADTFLASGSFDYNGGEIDTDFLFMEKETAGKRSIGKIEIVEDSEFTSGVYLPMIYGTDNNFSVGKTIEITVGDRVESYTVCGFFNSVMVGSHNCGMSEILLTKDKYKELEESGLYPKSTLVSVRIRDKAESEDFEAVFKNAVTSRYPDLRTESNSYEMVSSGRYISQMICSSIISVMGFLVALIALVVIFSNVVNDIQRNMKDLGALKAIGYRSRQIISALLLQFLSVAFVTALAGIGISYCLFPAINSMMMSQTGIPYAMKFLPLPFVMTLVLIGGMVALSVWLSSRRIKTIEPIVALRQGIQTHSFKRNHIPLERTRVSLNTALALKTTFSGVKQNVTACITMLVLSLAVTFTGMVVRNVITDVSQFVDLVIGETADSCIRVTPEWEKEFLQKMEEDDRVTKTYLFTTEEVRHVGGIALLANISDDFSKLNNPNICIEGRFPKYDNEMAIGAKYAKEHDLKIGEEITLTAEGKEAVYMISGYTQISNYLGKDCVLTRGGFERLGKLQSVNYNLNVADGVDVDALNEDLSGKFGNSISGTVNYKSAVDAGSAVYISLMKMIVIAILILCIFVITFVLYLLVRTMLTTKQRDYGIQKALGFTTRQLVLQTAISFMPSVILSTVVGLVVSFYVVRPLTALFLSGIGIVKCTFIVPVDFIFVAGIGLILYAFVIACLLSVKIRKIAPRSLITECV